MVVCQSLHLNGKLLRGGDGEKYIKAGKTDVKLLRVIFLIVILMNDLYQ